MDETTTDRLIIKCVAAVVITIIVSIAGCVSNTNYQSRLALEHGIAPLEVACVFSDSQSSVCPVAAIGRK